MKQSKVLAYAHTIEQMMKAEILRRKTLDRQAEALSSEANLQLEIQPNLDFFYYVLNSHSNKLGLHSVPASNLLYRITLQEKLLSMCFNAAETQPRQGSSFWFHEEGTSFQRLQLAVTEPPSWFLFLHTYTYQHSLLLLFLNVKSILRFGLQTWHVFYLKMLETISPIFEKLCLEQIQGDMKKKLRHTIYVP